MTCQIISIHRSAADVKEHMWKKQERKASKTELLSLPNQNDSGIHLTIILQEVGKEFRHLSLLRVIQRRIKMQKTILAYEARIFCSN